MAEKNMQNGDLESAMRRLDEVLKSLSVENVTLEKALTLYEEGVALVKECNARLESAQRKIELLKMNADGEVTAEPFDTSAI